MSTPIVIQLQADCLDSSVSISNLLRKAQLIASKLELTNLSLSIDSELKGYDCSRKDLPSHRVGVGVPKYFNPYQGWISLVGSSGPMWDMVSSIHLFHPAAELEHIISSDSSAMVVFGIDKNLEDALFSSGGYRFNTGIFVSKSVIFGALDFSRNAILEWSLSLESNGILGNGLSFSSQDKIKAHNVTNYIYGGNIGNIGNVDGKISNSKFISKSGSVNISELRSITEQSLSLVSALPSELQSKANDTLVEIAGEAEKTAPSSGKIIAAINSLKSILEGATGNIAAAAILAAFSG